MMALCLGYCFKGMSPEMYSVLLITLVSVAEVTNSQFVFEFVFVKWKYF